MRGRWGSVITSLQIITTAFTQSRDAHPPMPAMLPMQQQPLQPFSSFPPMHPIVPGAMVPGMQQPASIPVAVAQQVEFAGPAEEVIDSAVETVLVGDTLLVGGGGGGEA